MRQGLVALWSVVLILAGGGVGTAAVRYGQSRSEAASSLAVLSMLRSQGNDLSSLRASAPAWMTGGRPAPGLTTRVTSVLTASGLPASALSSVSPEAESPIGEADLKARRSRAVLTLAPVTLPQLGAFLKEWRTREPRWTVSGIDLSPQQGAEKGAPAGGDLPLRAVLSLETIFVGRGGDR